VAPGLTIGLAGWIGTGKSTVCSLFKSQLGAEILSLDDISHDLYSNPKLCRKLESVFGTSQRKEIAVILGNNPNLWDDLDDIFRPFLIEETMKLLDDSNATLRVIEGSLLLKLNLHRVCDLVIWMSVHPLEEAVKRSSVRMDRPFTYCLNILNRQIESGIFDPSKIDVFETQTCSNGSREVYEDIRRHLHF
jgi:dephospho-CoA kinase